MKIKGYLHQKQVRCKLSPRWQLLIFFLFFFFLNLNDKALEVLGAMICPLLLRGRQKDHKQLWGAAEARGGRSSPPAAPVMPSLPLARKLDSSTDTFPGYGHGHATAQPPRLLRVQCVNPPPLLLQLCSETLKPVATLTTAGTSERKGVLHCPPASGSTKGFRALPKFSCIQLCHAAVADYSAVRLLPLRGRAEGSFMEQVIGSISRYRYLLVSWSCQMVPVKIRACLCHQSGESPPLSTPGTDRAGSRGRRAPHLSVSLCREPVQLRKGNRLS